MKRRSGLCLLLFLVGTLLPAQQKKITLDDIWGGTFRTEGLEVLRSMNDGQHYTVLQTNAPADRSSIEKYEYRTQQKVGTLLESDASKGVPLFSSYEFSDDESKVLLATGVEAIYRRSRLGIYYVYDLKSGGLKQISENKIQEPTLSPGGDKVAFVYENNLYVLDLETDRLSQITADGRRNAIINGVTDWVYEEEFGFVRAFEWNATGSKIAFLRFDESAVPEFSMDV